jgi:hypothetical protein
MLRLYIIGIVVLLVAFAANMLAHVWGVKTWYDLFVLLQEHGWLGLRKLRVKDSIWLFVLYPLILGGGCMAGVWCYKVLSA